MTDLDNFVPIHIDIPEAAPQPAANASDVHQKPDTDFWSRVADSFRSWHQFTPSAEAIAMLTPADDEKYRMVPTTDALQALQLKHPVVDNYLDEGAQAELNVKLGRMDLVTATNISGPLRLRTNDLLPIVRAQQPLPNRSACISLCLYLIAWILQTDGATSRDMALIDAWIDAYEPKEQWAPAAKAMVRWLLSRRLFMTHKRKLRAAKLKRFQNIRGRLVSLLLQIVSDPQYASPKRMQRLATVYAAVGLNPADIHADIHRQATSPTMALTKPSTATEISTTRLQEMLHNTHRAQRILADVFVDDEPTQAPAQWASNESPAIHALHELAQCAEWPRATAEEVAKRNGLTLGALLEHLNDMAYDTAGDAVADDADDTIYINTDIAQQCLAKH